MNQKAKQACSPERRGSGLIFAVVLLFVILGMVVTLSSVTVLETKMNQKTKSSVGAFYNSESGVEWALNQISNASSPDTTTVQSKFGLAANGSKTCPSGFGCDIYFLKADGTVITQAQASSLYISDIKAVRSVGTQGGETQRAIEAAVAAGGGGCYVDYALSRGLSVGSPCYVAGFTIKGSAGIWGYCTDAPGYPIMGYYFRPPGGGCGAGGAFTDSGVAYVCCM